MVLPRLGLCSPQLPSRWRYRAQRSSIKQGMAAGIALDGTFAQAYPSAMKQAVMKTARRIRDGIRKLGLDVRTVRGRDHWRAGVEFIWRPFDERTERARICQVDSFGETVWFLVRNPEDYIQSHYLTGKFYAEDELRLIQEHYKGRAFLDIGANVGNHTLFAAKILRAPRVIACEPNPTAYRILNSNIALNDLGEIVDHISFGISDHDGHAAVELSQPLNLGTARLRESDDGIMLRTGDALFSGDDIGFIKLDIEGMEMAALRGMEGVIGRCRPVIMVEVDDSNAEAFAEWRARMGYGVAAQLNPYTGQANFLITAI